jgi:uncharacterized membrane protein YfcA
MTDVSLFIPAAAAFMAAVLTLMTGFGLGTVLTPVFLLFYDVKIAILIVAIVHLLNNLAKVSIFRRDIDFTLLKRFGIVTLIGAFAGALLQGVINSGHVKIVLGIALIFLGIKEISGFGEKMRLPRKIDVMGGFLSGLLGGLVGNQGAVRSAYLLNYPLSKETFIATAAVIASIVDITRIPVYIITGREQLLAHYPLIAITTLSALIGTFTAKRFMKKVSLTIFKRYVAGSIILIGLLLAAKII